MGHKHISEQSVKELRSKEKGAESSGVVSDMASWSKYKHCYFEEVDINNPEAYPILIFTVRVNYLPSKPVYIDIRNLRELILNMTSEISNHESIKLRRDLLDLLSHYEKIS